MLHVDVKDARGKNTKLAVQRDGKDLEGVGERKECDGNVLSKHFK